MTYRMCAMQTIYQKQDHECTCTSKRNHNIFCRYRWPHRPSAGCSNQPTWTWLLWIFITQSINHSTHLVFSATVQPMSNLSCITASWWWTLDYWWIGTCPLWILKEMQRLWGDLFVFVSIIIIFSRQHFSSSVWACMLAFLELFLMWKIHAEWACILVKKILMLRYTLFNFLFDRGQVW